MRAEIHDNLESIPDLNVIWEQALPLHQFYAGEYLDYAELAERSDVRLRLVVLRQESGQPIVAPFFISMRKKSFAIGERRLFSLEVHTMTLYSQWLMQHANEHQIKEIFNAIKHYTDFDWIDLGEIPINSPVHKALTMLGWRWIVSQRSRKISRRWLIDLPDDFESYLQNLSSKTRKMTRQMVRKLEKKYDIDLTVMTKSADIDQFLREGEKISRKTYQWNVGQRLCDDEETRSKYVALCEKGQLRTYLVSVDGQPSAFSRGTISNGMFHYETPGFDPAFSKDSLGTVLLLYNIRDIIENTSCRIYDFGIGGDVSGYKSRYGNRSIDCMYLELGRRTSLTANAVAALQFTLNKLKNIANMLLGQGDLRRKIKRAIRQSGE